MVIILGLGNLSHLLNILLGGAHDQCDRQQGGGIGLDAKV